MLYPRWISASIIICLLSIAGCENLNTQLPEKNQPARTVNSVLEKLTGVWMNKEANETIIFTHNDNRLSFYVNDRAIPIRIGDIDESNKSVNIILLGKIETIATVKWVPDGNTENTYHLLLTLPSGQEEIYFIRRVSIDDMNRLAVSNAGGDNKNSANSVTPSEAEADAAADAAVAAGATAPDLDAMSNPETRYANSPSDGFVALRSDPSIAEGSRFKKIPHGGQVSVFYCKPQNENIGVRHGHWCKIEYNEITGWAFDYYLSRTAIFQ